MSWLSQYFGGGGDPAGAANPYYQQIPGVAEKYYNPFIQRGAGAGGILSGQFDKMSQDPSGFIDALMKNYSGSEGYKLKQEQMQRAAGNAAAAGGMRGSQADISNEADISRRLQGEDMQQWLQNVLGVQHEGLGGEQHLYDVGFDASGRAASDIENALGEQGQLAFQGERQRMADRSGRLGGLGSALGGLFGLGMPGGGSLGGGLASKFLSNMGWM